MFEKEELKPIDPSKYKITETGQVLKMTKEELEREYYGRRPTEPYSEDDSPNDWANIVQYAEENLGKAFKAIAELEKENAELKDKLEVLIAVGNTCTKGLNKQLIKAKEIINLVFYQKRILRVFTKLLNKQSNL